MANFWDGISASNGGLKTHQHVSLSSVALLVDTMITEKGWFCPAVPAPLRIPGLARFDSKRDPPISVYDYLDRLRQYGGFETSFVIALIYIDRLLAADPNFVLTYRNIHRLLLTCTVVAEKYINDTYYDNRYYGSVGGVCIAEMNYLEVILINALKWRLGVSPEEYNKKQEELRGAFMAVLSASESTKWIVLEEASCETSCEAVCDKDAEKDVPSESSMEASTTWGSESAPSESSMQASSISSSQSVSGSSEDIDMDSSSEVDEADPPLPLPARTKRNATPHPLPAPCGKPRRCS
jgi:hypothetical protein